METRHTRGPWLSDERARSQKGAPFFCTVRDTRFFHGEGLKAGREIVANAYGTTEELAEANARLIAAAPATAKERDELKTLNAELLEALKDLTQYIPSIIDPETLHDLPVLLESAEKVIKKAKGQ